MSYSTKSGAGRKVVYLLVVLALAFAGWRYYASKKTPDAGAPAAQAPQAPARGGAGGPGGPGGPGAMRGKQPVSVTKAAFKDMQSFLVGLGTITSPNTVTVRSRVDGQLMGVFFQEGQMVREGQLLAQIDERPFQVQLTQAQGQLAKDRAQLENARMDLRRYQQIFGQQVISRQQLDTQAALVKQFEGAVQSDQGQVDNARLQLVYSRITAPITGKAGLRSVDPGNIVRSTDTSGLVTITQLTPINVIFAIPEDSLPRVLESQRGGKPLAVEVYDREQKKLLDKGVLLSVDNQIDTSTGTVRLKAELPNAAMNLYPNQFVNARVLVGTAAKALVVPTQSVLPGSQGSMVYVVKPDNTAEMRRVETGESLSGQTAIVKGLSEGETVVVEGADRLRDGAPVEIRDGTPGAAAPSSAPSAAPASSSAPSSAAAPAQAPDQAPTPAPAPSAAPAPAPVSRNGS